MVSWSPYRCIARDDLEIVFTREESRLERSGGSSLFIYQNFVNCYYYCPNVGGTEAIVYGVG